MYNRAKGAMSQVAWMRAALERLVALAEDKSCPMQKDWRIIHQRYEELKAEHEERKIRANNDPEAYLHEVGRQGVQELGWTK